MKSVSKTDEISRVQQRQEKLRNALPDPNLSRHEKETLFKFLVEHHDAFSLDEGERGETNLIQMEIDTGTAAPKKQRARRLPFAVRQEVARQLEQMQTKGVIQPSKSPWASPVVLVKKRDGTHRFCIDYRGLNSVTKLDSFPLPRIEDLLDQLGRSKYFSTIDLASGFWQIQMHPIAQEKTAFVTHLGLFEFRVMPFGLTNAPAVFQRLMQQVVSPLNPRSGVDFVSVYLDDILVFSRSLEEHLEHLKTVIQRLSSVGLKLKPAKCRFVQEELEYLGHIVSRDGLRTTPRLVSAVRDFPVPRAVQDVRRFLGLASYYRRFIPGFAQIARPLHSLTCKDTRFVWSSECKQAFEVLKQKLTTSPVLAYPNFDRDFVLETDASVQGIGAVLGQYQDDHKLHPVAYASRALSAAEKHYGITELETLAVVWAISHFHHYLYGHTVTVFTDHTAVKAVLETANPTAKHARWWTRVYGRGIKKVNIVYRAGRENRNADALSRQPQLPAPEVGIAENEVHISAVTSGGETMQADRGVDTSPAVREKVEEQDLRVKSSPHLPAESIEENLPAAHEEFTVKEVPNRPTESMGEKAHLPTELIGEKLPAATLEEVPNRPTESIGEKVQNSTHRPESRPHLPAADEKLISDNLPADHEELTGEEVLDRQHLTSTHRFKDRAKSPDETSRKTGHRKEQTNNTSPIPKIIITFADGTVSQFVEEHSWSSVSMESTTLDLNRDGPRVGPTSKVAGACSVLHTVEDYSANHLESFATEQRKDPDVREIYQFAENGTLPTEDKRARRLVLEGSLFTIVDGILYFLDPKHGGRKRAVVPKQLRKHILEEAHSGAFAAHFSGQRLYSSLMLNWWWRGMFNDCVKFAKACPECAIATGSGRRLKPHLKPIQVSRPFQILGIDVMDLPLTEKGNKHVVVVQDLFTKWPFVFATPDQKTERIARLLTEEVVPWFGVPESLLSDRGTNFLSHLMQDLCKMLGITKLNTTAYHPQCDGAVERLNRTLKTVLRKHAARFGCQWDNHIPGILWAYRNTPHSSTGETPSFLLYGLDCRSPLEAAYLPASNDPPTDVSDYREELMISLTSARELAATTLQEAQARY